MCGNILYQENARRALGNGMSVLAEAVCVTLGPKGKNVVLSKDQGTPLIINDGVSIANEVELDDHIENTGVMLIRQAASKTNEVAGDGTTTATVLAYAIIKEGMRNVAAGANPIALKRGIDKSVQFFVNEVLEHARPVEDTLDIKNVAAISAGNDDTVGEMISSSLDYVGREGIIYLEESKAVSTEVEITEGIGFDKGYISPYFVTDVKRSEIVQENPYILITDRKIAFVKADLVPIMEVVAKLGRPLLIIADNVEKEPLATLVVNKMRGILSCAAVRAPGFGDRRKALLEDIAILTGGQFISEDTGLSLDSLKLEMLGQARRVTINKERTTILSNIDPKIIEARADQIRRQIETTDTNYDKEKLQERLAKLSGGVVVIKVGAATETEMKDKKLRLEDAINATKAAVEEGIVPGGGATMVHLSKNLLNWAKRTLKEDELLGALIVEKALKAPLTRISENAGQNGAIIVDQILQSDFSVGYDALNDEFVNMYKAGIVDPAKVTRSSLQNAASIAGMVLTTECIIVKQKDEELEEESDAAVSS